MIIVVTSEEGPYSAQAHPASTDPLVVVVTPDDAANSVRASEAGTDIVNHLKKVAVRFERVLGVNIA
jgi:type IV pilus biogenesis protein CpaD/CtpE